MILSSTIKTCNGSSDETLRPCVGRADGEEGLVDEGFLTALMGEIVETLFRRRESRGCSWAGIVFPLVWADGRVTSLAVRHSIKNRNAVVARGKLHRRSVPQILLLHASRIDLPLPLPNSLCTSIRPPSISVISIDGTSGSAWERGCIALSTTYSCR